MQDDNTEWVIIKSWSLCPRCERTVGNFLVSSSSFVTYPPYEKLVDVRAQPEQCPVCQAILRGFEVFERVGEYSEWQKIDIGCYRGLAAGMMIVSLNTCTFRSRRLDSVSQFFISLQNGLGFGNTTGKFSMKADDIGYLKLEAIEFMREQLSTCLSDPKHISCCPGSTIPSTVDVQWPARLLKIRRKPTDSKQLEVALVNFSPDMADNFAALSYCWGPGPGDPGYEPLLKLDRSTESRMRIGVPISDLPLTLRQAVITCSYIEVNYIWIDALCIFQDQGSLQSDWDNEAPKMATVYGRSIVTMIAASGTSCHSGLIPGRPDCIYVSSPSEPCMGLLVQRKNQTGFHHRSSTSIFDPIDTRGWTYQEELLSGRIIRFTETDVQWQCNTHRLCLCRQPADRDMNWGSDRLPSRWCLRLVGDFSCREFTVDHDKLAALSGLAQKYRQLMPEEIKRNNSYIAGNWKCELLPLGGSCSLAWSATLGSRPTAKHGYPQTYVAPSFSWASVNSPVKFVYVIRGNRLPVSKIMDVGTTLVSEQDPFGRVSDGFLVLRGPFLPCTIRVNYDDDDGHSKFSLALNVTQRTTGLPFSTNGENKCYLDGPLQESTLPSGERTVHRSTGGTEQIEYRSWESVHFLVLYKSAVDVLLDGLILGREPTGKRYQRLGYARVAVFKGEEMDLNSFEETVTIG
ncbi:heterokaryon incompatibility protein-domain-containing protein [Podospora fimiseda]|uniref:Heterokaryon incompatibility protein-domain-containing protein n=1 Tax=Podospora fimiseda TaxID=252190 RepID=A0AAN7H2H2_9PEZI|nr:heterokaryon incompatibility protein-domain-containing protein [Podospora fimiseda]